MLAQNFMTASELDITDAEHGALIKTLAFLERAEARHIDIGDPDCGTGPNHFNMAAWDCGTCHCILGWARSFVGGKPHFSDLTDGLWDLCYPNRSACGGLNGVTVEQAAAALRNYLTLGDAHWSEV